MSFFARYWAYLGMAVVCVGGALVPLPTSATEAVVLIEAGVLLGLMAWSYFRANQVTNALYAYDPDRVMRWGPAVMFIKSVFLWSIPAAFDDEILNEPLTARPALAMQTHILGSLIVTIPLFMAAWVRFLLYP